VGGGTVKRGGKSHQKCEKKRGVYGGVGGRPKGSFLGRSKIIGSELIEKEGLHLWCKLENRKF